MVYLVRVYPNGEAKHSRREGDQSDYLVYNKKARPGCAVFVDGDCVQGGALNMEQLVLVGKAIQREMEDSEHTRLDVDEISPQEERYGGIVDRLTGYRPERDRTRFFDLCREAP